VTPDGGTLIYHHIFADDHREIWRLSLDGDPMPEPVLSGEGDWGGSGLSPDGRWLVYRSDESGQMEIYVRPFDRPGGPTPVSIGGGWNARFSRDGSEIYYRVEDRMIAVAFEGDGDVPTVGRRTELFSGSYHMGSGGARQFDVGPDGRFLMLKVVPGADPSTDTAPMLILYQNFFEELRERAPAN
jgi:hypothetical protein